jgi:hypothetical protein
MMEAKIKAAKPKGSPRRRSTSTKPRGRRPHDGGLEELRRVFGDRADVAAPIAIAAARLANLRDQVLGVVNADGRTAMRGVRNNHKAYSSQRRDLMRSDARRIDARQAELGPPVGMAGISQNPTQAPADLAGQANHRLAQRRETARQDNLGLDRAQNREDRQAVRDIRAGGRSDVQTSYAAAQADMLVQRVLAEVQSSRGGGYGGGGGGYGGGGYGGYSYGGGYGGYGYGGSDGGWDPMGEFYSEPMSDTQLMELFRASNLNDANGDLFATLSPRQSSELAEVVAEGANANPIPYDEGYNVAHTRAVADQRYAPTIDFAEQFVEQYGPGSGSGYYFGLDPNTGQIVNATVDSDLTDDEGRVEPVTDEDVLADIERYNRIRDEQNISPHRPLNDTATALRRRLAALIRNLQAFHATPYNNLQNYNGLALTAGRRPIEPVPMGAPPSYQPDTSRADLAAAAQYAQARVQQYANAVAARQAAAARSIAF